MRYSKVRIASVGQCIASDYVSSAEIEQRLAPAYRSLHISAGQFEALTGIVGRRFWSKQDSDDPNHLSRFAAQAAAQALHKDGCTHLASSVDTLIYGSVCREYFEPATAVSVASRLREQGMSIPLRSGVYDIANACLGMVQAIIEVANQIELGAIQSGLVVGCESARDIVMQTIDELNADPTHERFRYKLATLTGGSGAAAVLLCHEDLAPASSLGVLGAVTRSAPEHHALCRWGYKKSGSADTGRVFTHTDAMGILKHGVSLGSQTWQAFLEDMQWDVSDIDRTVCHQVGRSNREQILNLLKLKPEHDLVNYDRFGNTGSVALPSALAEAWQSKFIQTGQNIACLGIGSGLNCAMLGLRS